MPHSVRQIFFISLVIIFIGAITVVLFYGSGYNINWQSGDIETTSDITVIAIPKDAVITLEPLGSTKISPARFGQLKPERYDVTISAPGYYTQSLSITMNPQAAIQFNPIQLWPQTSLPNLIGDDSTLAATVPTTIFNDQPATIYQNHQTGQWLLQQNNSLYVYNPDSRITSTLVRLSEPIIAATWHPNGWYVLYSTATQIHMIDTRLDYTTHDVILTTAAVATNLNCRSNGLTCYFTSHNQTYALPLR